MSRSSKLWSILDHMPQSTKMHFELRVAVCLCVCAINLRATLFASHQHLHTTLSLSCVFFPLFRPSPTVGTKAEECYGMLLQPGSVEADDLRKCASPDLARPLMYMTGSSRVASSLSQHANCRSQGFFPLALRSSQVLIWLQHC